MIYEDTVTFIVFTIIYIILIVVFRKWVEAEKIPGWLGFIPIYIVMGLLAARLLYAHGRANTKNTGTPSTEGGDA